MKNHIRFIYTYYLPYEQKENEIMIPMHETGRATSTNGEKRNAYRIVVQKPEGKRPLRTPSRRWVDNIKLDLRKIPWEGVYWIDMAQNMD
jgi:hypothetical protein